MTQGTHAVITGPIQGLVTLADGTVVDASPAVVYVDTHEAALDLADKVGKHYEANGHPDDIEADEDGVLVQRAFVYDPEVKPIDFTGLSEADLAKAVAEINKSNAPKSTTKKKG